MNKTITGLGFIILVSGCSSKVDVPMTSQEYEEYSEVLVKAQVCDDLGLFIGDSTLKDITRYHNLHLRSLTYDKAIYANWYDEHKKEYQENISSETCSYVKNNYQKFYNAKSNEYSAKVNNRLDERRRERVIIGQFFEALNASLNSNNTYPTYSQAYRSATSPTINLPSPTRPNTNANYLNKQKQNTPKVFQTLTSSKKSGNSIICTYSLGRVKYVNIYQSCPRTIY
jgi:hypothetical protein